MRLQMRSMAVWRACRRLGAEAAAAVRGDAVQRDRTPRILQYAPASGLFLLLAMLFAAAPLARAQAVRNNPGFSANSIPRNDDGSTDSAINLGFTVNFFGATFSTAYVNNNGNITFGGPLAKYTPEGLIGSPLRIIAPFWADVDTRAAGSALVTYGRDTVNGRTAFGVNWVNVGYYGNHDDKLNSFQLVLIERSDIGPGNFDIEFNYDRILWETGDASGGRGGLGGTPASAGYSNGTGTRDGSFEILGSRRTTVFLDSNRNALKRRTLNSGVRGRLVFFVRQGSVDCTYATLALDQLLPWEGGTGTVQVGAPSGCKWTAVSNSRFIKITSPADGNGSGSDDVLFTVAPNRSSCPRSGTLTIAGQVIVINQEPHVTMKVTPPALTISPIGGSFPAHLALRIDSIRNPVNWTASADPVNQPGWRLTLTPVSGTASDQQPSTLLLDLAPTLQPTFGVIATITVRDTVEGTAVVVPLTMLPGGRLLLSQTSFSFRVAEGDAAPASQTLFVTNSGQGSLNWSIPSASLSSAPWLRFSSMTGVAAAGSTNPSSTTVAVSPSGLAPGVYQALVPVTSADAGNETELVTVTLHVVAAASAASPDVSPSGMVFTAVQGGAAPAAQTLAISNLGGGGDPNFQPISLTDNWLRVSTGSGGVATAVQVTANPAGLSAGIYRAKLTVSFATGEVQDIPISFIVTPPPGRNLVGVTSCTPQAMDVVGLTFGNGATTALSFARPMLARAVDNCGGAVNNVTVLVDIADTANTRIVMQPIGNGLYSGMWTPQEEGPGIPMKLIALHPSFAGMQRTFAMSVATAPGEVSLPGIATDGVAEAAGCALQQALAPGSIITVSGSGLARSDAYSTAVPLDRQLVGSSVLIGAEYAPLFFVGSEQIQAQVPFGAKPWERVPIVVNANGLLSAPQNYLIAPVQPAVFDSDGNASALDGQSRPITADNPARIGDTLQIFANGLGLVDPGVETGTASPSSSIVRSRVRVSIGGVEVPVIYQGLVPGYVGLYQVKVLLTSSITPGDDLPIIIRQDGIISNASSPLTIPVRRP